MACKKNEKTIKVLAERKKCFFFLRLEFKNILTILTMPITIDQYMNYMNQFPDRIQCELELKDKQFTDLSRELETVYDNEYLVKILEHLIYENRLERMLIRAVVSNNRNVCIMTVKRIKEKMHEYLDIFMDACQNDVFNDDQWKEASDTRMLMFNTFNSLILE